jgi:hypothetical protein
MVLNNVDPLQKGRIQVQVPDVLGLGLSSWAMPCMPMTGVQAGVYAVPPIGAGVWVEFEGGNPEAPHLDRGILGLGGGGAGAGPGSQRPGLAQHRPPDHGAEQHRGERRAGHRGNPPEEPGGAMILVNDVGITISNGRGASIVLAGPSVTVNNGALVVT